MLWLIQNVIFSISLIVVIHYLYIYFETTLTAPKVKDLIHCPKQKYKSLFDTINTNLDNDNLSQKGRNLGGETGGRSSSEETEHGLLPKNYNDPPGNIQPPNDDRNSMKTDLKAFLRGIGLKSKSNTESLFRASYETS